MKKTPRAQRKVVQLEGWKMTYYPDLSARAASSVAYTDFIKLAEAFSDNAAQLHGFGTKEPSNSNSSYGGGGRSGARRGPRAGAGMKRMQAVVRTDASQSGPVRRGYIVTIRCRTPNAVPAALVNDTVAKALASRNQSAPNPPRNYSIVRVERAEVRAVTPQDRPAEAVHEHRARPVNKMLGMPGFNPGGPGGGPARAGGAPTFDPFRQQNAPGGAVQPETEKVDPWEDPLVPGESMQHDSIVTLVVAVVLDPPKPAPSNSQVAVANP
jgi:hypothetical protein